MYAPPFNVVEDEREVRAMVADVGAAELVTTGDDGYPVATLLPIMWEGDTVVAHLARANPHWHTIADDTPTLLIVAGPQAYVSPSWYAEHGRVVPTWNYTTVHLTGRATVHENPAWLRDAVTRLTDIHEADTSRPWSVSDAPTAFIDGQLGGIVGVEITVEQVTAKAKLSQNRSTADRRGVVDGLHATGRTRDAEVADQMSPVDPS